MTQWTPPVMFQNFQKGCLPHGLSLMFDPKMEFVMKHYIILMMRHSGRFFWVFFSANACECIAILVAQEM